MRIKQKKPQLKNFPKNDSSKFFTLCKTRKLKHKTNLFNELQVKKTQRTNQCHRQLNAFQNSSKNEEKS
jgi:hypothetical protein